MGLFWGDSPDAVARKHLRDTLWRIRQVLRSAGRSILQLRVQDGSVACEVGDACWLDTREFESLLGGARTRVPEAMTQADAHPLEEALALFRGDLLEEVYDDWCVYDRERLRGLAVDAMQQLMMYHLHRHEWGLALQRGLRLLAVDPLHEDVHRTVMRCYACSGNRGAALRQFQTCTRLLREELSVTPMPETVALFDGIRAGALPLPIEPRRTSADISAA
jgi:DNA-binding SARP family transcriptional activator